MTKVLCKLLALFILSFAQIYPDSPKSVNLARESFRADPTPHFLASRGIQAKPTRPLKINVFSINNGVGLEAQRKLMRKALESLGHIVHDREYNEMPTLLNLYSLADINIFMEIICPQWLPYAKLNWLVPNPEWYVQDLALLNKIDLALCFTHEAERIFREMGINAYFSGFTSFDCYHSGIEKNFSRYLHVAGKSTMKGTPAIADLWKTDRSLPQLTVICHWWERPFFQENLEWISTKIPENRLRHLQNHCGIHLCPSETEGFGHYIMEAMSAGAVVVTTDAPPMNEFITDKRCLVPYQKIDQRYLATRYFIAPEDLEKTIRDLRSLPESELKKIGENNRAMYLQKTQEFQANLERLLNQVQSPLPRF